MKNSQSGESGLTRGTGLLEPLLARLRARRANKLIPDSLREGRILDVGCGSYPYFLSQTSFREKFAIDQLIPMTETKGITTFTHDLNVDPNLPFEDNFFSVITMLAIAEHLNPNSLASFFDEAYRTLIPGGIVILTTPAAWSDGLLKWMARVNLVSEEEINEHVFAYTLPLLGWYFGGAKFPMEKTKFGYFEFGLNLWATAEK